MSLPLGSGSLLVGGLPLGDVEDDDDADLGSFMTELSMTRTAVRRNRGGWERMRSINPRLTPRAHGPAPGQVRPVKRQVCCMAGLAR
jgi:hypothetical protein